MRVVVAIFILVVLGAAGVFLPKLRENYTRGFEDSVRTSLTATESALRDVSSNFSDVRLYATELERARDTWSLRGIISLTTVGDLQQHVPFHARLDGRCLETRTNNCSALVSLEIGSKKVIENGRQIGALSLFDVTIDSENVEDDGVTEQPAELGFMSEQDTEAASAISEEAASGSDEPDAGPSVDGAKDQFATERQASSESEEAPSDGSLPRGGQQGLVLKVQRNLAAHGYDPGPIDGVPGPKTVSAIRNYQRREGLGIDGKATRQLLEHLERTTR